MVNVLAHLSDIVIPLLIFFVVGYGLVSRVKVYESFLKGAQEGIKIVIDIVPTLTGLLVAVGMLRASGFFSVLGKILCPVTESIGLPAELIPLLIVKLFSSSAATGLVLDIFKTSWSGFLCRDADFGSDELYGNGFLYHERLLSGGKGDKNPVHAGRGALINPGGNHCEYPFDTGGQLVGNKGKKVKGAKESRQQKGSEKGKRKQAAERQ